MAGHGPAPVIAAVERQLRRGITTMLPTEDAAWVGEELTRRFGLTSWQFTLTATDANRFSLRIARAITGRPLVAVHEYCYHGSVDETFAVLDDAGRVVARRGNLGPPVDPAVTTRVVPFNDLDALDRALADRQVAALLIEPALTNVGIVLPDPGYLEGVREITRRHGTILIHDETHTICAGPGGVTGLGGYAPDMLVIGKTFGGGIPIGTYGMTAEVADRVRAAEPYEDSDVGGIGGTLAGYALSMAAARAALGEVLTAVGVRADAPARGTLGARRQRRDRPARRALERDPARRSRRVPLHAGPAARRRRADRHRRSGARPAAPPVGHEPGRPDDAVPQHGADVAGDDRGGRRPPHRGVRRGRGGALRLIAAPGRDPMIRVMSVVAHEAAHLDGATLERARRRSRAALFIGVGFGSTGYIAAVTVATIVAKDLLGDESLAGVPSATVVLGAAAGAVILSSVMARRGRRIGLTLGYLVAVLGALVATLAVVLRSFPLLILGTFLIGFGNSANNLSRYAAADLVPTKRRPVAIGLVVWAATIGGVVGPWLVPAGPGAGAALQPAATRRSVPGARRLRRDRGVAVLRAPPTGPVRARRRVGTARRGARIARADPNHPDPPDRGRGDRGPRRRAGDDDADHDDDAAPPDGPRA